MTPSKTICFALFTIIIVNSVFAQDKVLKYSISIFSDTSLQDTVRINIAYDFFDMGERNSFARVVPADKSYLVEVFSKKTVDSLGFLIERFLPDTTYSISRKEFVQNLQSDLKRSRSHKSPVENDWRYSFIVKEKTVASLHAINSSYLYGRLRFNPSLAVK